MALRSGFRAEIGHFRDVPMWVNGKTADLAEKIKSLFWAPGGAPPAADGGTWGGLKTA